MNGTTPLTLFSFHIAVPGFGTARSPAERFQSWEDLFCSTHHVLFVGLEGTNQEGLGEGA